jgi:hypothetical protein
MDVDGCSSGLMCCSKQAKYIFKRYFSKDKRSKKMHHQKISSDKFGGPPNNTGA